MCTAFRMSCSLHELHENIWGGGASYKTLGAAERGPNVPFQLFSSGKKRKNQK
jgi:hypothetical protein